MKCVLVHWKTGIVGTWDVRLVPVGPTMGIGLVEALSEFLPKFQMTMVFCPEYKKNRKEDGGGKEAENDGSRGDESERSYEGHGGEDEDAESGNRSDGGDEEGRTGVLQCGMDGILDREVSLVEIFPETLYHVDRIIDTEADGERGYRHRQHIQGEAWNGIPPSVILQDVVDEGNEGHGTKDPDNIQSNRDD